jgi:hypothetical protein
MPAGLSLHRRVPRLHLMNLRLTRAELETKAKSKPPGFLAEMLRVGTPSGEHFEFSKEVLTDLHSRHPEFFEPCANRFGPCLPPGKKLTLREVGQKFAASMLYWSRMGFPTVDNDRHEKRYAVCQSCPQFNNFICGECGCVAFAKSKLETESCPLGKW